MGSTIADGLELTQVPPDRLVLTTGYRSPDGRRELGARLTTVGTKEGGSRPTPAWQTVDLFYQQSLSCGQHLALHLTIFSTKTTPSSRGPAVDSNANLVDHFAGFKPIQPPIFLLETGETTQILHLGTPTTGSEADTWVVLLEWNDLLYIFCNHTVSGTIETICMGNPASSGQSGGLRVWNNRQLTFVGGDMDGDGDRDFRI